VSERYPLVTTPIRVGPVQVRNRFFMPAHGLLLSVGGPHGSRIPSEDMVHYYAERAAAGVGLFVLSTAVNPRSFISCAYHRDGVPAFRALAEAVHSHGARIFGQLSHFYNQRLAWEPLGQMAPVLGVSAYANYQHRFGCHEMAPADIAAVVQQHAQCAANLAAAGFDGIEVHCAHGMLAEQFVSPYFNQRTDEYGGSFEGRLRFLIEVLEVVRGAVGPGRAVGMRFNCDEMLPGGLTQEDAREVVGAIAERGLLDFVNLDISVEPQQQALLVAPQLVEPLHMAAFIRAVAPAARRSGVVVMGCPGRVSRVQQAEDAIAAGDMDMVGAVRSLIAEPELLRHALEGREERNRPCIASNFCWSSAEMGAGWGCTVNPAAGRERRWGAAAPRAPKARRVVVAGAGPAGLEAARVAALRGHRVVVFERAPEVGGQLNLWGALPGRDLLLGLRDWYTARLTELGVGLRTGIEATAEAVLSEQPDSVLVATGSRYVGDGTSGFLNRPIPGWDLSHVYAPEAILEGGLRPQGRVLVLDEEGHHASAGVAEVLARSGAQVELATRAMRPLAQLVYTMELGLILQRLRKAGVRITTGVYVREIRAGAAALYDVVTGEAQERQLEAVVLATMRRSQAALAGELEGRVPQLLVVGDAAAPRGLVDATSEAHRLARTIGEPDAPRTLTEALFQPPPAESFARSAAVLLERTGV
jgi:2,4-dienoyl-CoA reductase-like NADH-dependent reductase (Old Yellow Enzyme family)